MTGVLSEATASEDLVPLRFWKPLLPLVLSSRGLSRGYTEEPMKETPSGRSWEDWYLYFLICKGAQEDEKDVRGDWMRGGSNEGWKVVRGQRERRTTWKPMPLMGSEPLVETLTVYVNLCVK